MGGLLRAWLVSFLGFACPGQVVTVANWSTLPHDGWLRATVSERPAVPAGDVDGATWVLGLPIGVDCWAVDVRVELAAGESKRIDLTASRPTRWSASLPPMDPATHFGAVSPSVNDVPMPLVGLWQDGAAWIAQNRVRHGTMLCTTLWTRYYPGQGWACSECITTASNPVVPDLLETITHGLRLSWGDAVVLVPGAPPGLVVPAGTTIADGQARAVPVVIVWARHLTPAGILSAIAAWSCRVGAVGDSSLWPAGDPILPPGFNAIGWGADRHAECIRRLHTWEPPVVGPNPRSSDTGAQEDQVFVRAEAKQAAAVEWIGYLSALKLAARPCHHLEADGSQLDPWRLRAQRLVLWDSRPHWHTGVSPDRLGKPSMLSDRDIPGGWWGADTDHWFHNTLHSAARITGSHAIDYLCSAQARIYPLQHTTIPGWSTSSTGSARAVGWEAIQAVQLHRTLRDRTLAEKIAAHWRDRLQRIIAPALRDRDVWDQRRDDRLGPGLWWICWQQSVGAFGLDLAGEYFGIPESRTIALRAANAVLRDSWQQVGQTWLSCAQRPVPGSDIAVPPPDGSFNYFGNALAVAVVLRHDPKNERARAIWLQLRADARQLHQTSWLAPGIDELIATTPEHPGGK